MVALSKLINLLNPLNSCKVPSSTLLLYNRNHKKEKKTNSILLLNHFHELQCDLLAYSTAAGGQ